MVPGEISSLLFGMFLILCLFISYIQRSDREASGLA